LVIACRKAISSEASSNVSAEAAALMKPYAGEIDAWEVGAAVGNLKNNRPELIERAGLL
jgi:hypothetical protein